MSRLKPRRTTIRVEAYGAKAPCHMRGAKSAPDFFGPRDFVLRRERCSRRGRAQKHEGCGTQLQNGAAIDFAIDQKEEKDSQDEVHSEEADEREPDVAFRTTRADSQRRARHAV